MAAPTRPFVLPHPDALASLFETTNTCETVRQALDRLAGLNLDDLDELSAATSGALALLERVRPADLDDQGAAMKVRFAAYDAHFGVVRSSATWWAVTWALAQSLQDIVTELRTGTEVSVREVRDLLAAARAYAARLVRAARA